MNSVGKRAARFEGVRTGQEATRFYRLAVLELRIFYLRLRAVNLLSRKADYHSVRLSNSCFCGVFMQSLSKASQSLGNINHWFKIYIIYTHTDMYFHCRRHLG